jgi:hypothetical protein
VLCISIHLCKCFTIIAVLLCTLQSIRKRLSSGRKPCTQLYGSFLHIFQLRSFQIIILQTFLIVIIINNNIGKYLLTCTRQKIKKERNCEFLVNGHYFKIGLTPKTISIHNIPFGQMRFIDKSILCQNFINFEAFYHFLGIFKNNWFFSFFHIFYQVNLELSPLSLLI